MAAFAGSPTPGQLRFTKRHTERSRPWPTGQLPKRCVEIKARVLGQKVRIRF